MQIVVLWSIRKRCKVPRIGAARLDRIWSSVSYRSQARVGHWVSTRLWSFRFARCFWIRLLSAALYWTLNPGGYIRRFGSLLSRLRLVLFGVFGWSRCDGGSRTPDLLDGTRCENTQLGLGRVQRLHGNRPEDSSVSRESALGWKQVRSRTGESTQQVFDAVSSPQVGTNMAATWSLFTGNLGTYWPMLKEVNTATNPPKQLLDRTLIRSHALTDSVNTHTSGKYYPSARAGVKYINMFQVSAQVHKQKLNLLTKQQ